MTEPGTSQRRRDIAARLYAGAASVSWNNPRHAPYWFWNVKRDALSDAQRETLLADLRALVAADTIQSVRNSEVLEGLRKRAGRPQPLLATDVEGVRVTLAVDLLKVGDWE